MKDINIRQMMADGMTVEQIQALVNGEIQAYQDEQEAEANEELSEVRLTLIAAFIDYLDLLGIIEDETDEDIDKFTRELEAAMIEIENELTKNKAFIKRFEATVKNIKPVKEEKREFNKRETDEEAIIKAFLKSIM